MNNTSYDYQLDTTLDISSNVNAAQSISVVDDMSQVPTTPTITSLTTPFNMNENQSLCPNLNIQAMTPDPTLQPMQDYQAPHLLAYPQETSKYSFFYAPCNDLQMYHIICEEMPLTFELVSQLINNTDNNLMNNYVQSNNTYVFYHEQPEIKKIYQVTCEMVSNTFIFQFLSKIIYGIQFIQIEHQQHQEFSKVHQENLKLHLKKDLIHYLAPNQAYERD